MTNENFKSFPKLQTYKIYEKTSFKDITDSINSFWDIKEVSDYRLKFLDEYDDVEELYLDDKTYVLEFLKLRTNIKFVKFIYVNSNGKEINF